MAIYNAGVINDIIKHIYRIILEKLVFILPEYSSSSEKKKSLRDIGNISANGSLSTSITAFPLSKYLHAI